MSHTLKWAVWTLGFAVVLAAAVAIRLDHVHRESGEWRLRPGAAPQMLRFDGHRYLREGTGQVRVRGFTQHGQDLGGGIILAPATTGTPGEIQVRSLTRLYDYRRAS
jgi:hypothetical protein